MKTDDHPFGLTPLWSRDTFEVDGEEFRLKVSNGETGATLNIFALPGNEWGGGIVAMPGRIDEIGTNRMTTAVITKGAAPDDIKRREFDIPPQTMLWNELRKPSLFFLEDLASSVTYGSKGLMDCMSKADRSLVFLWLMANVVGSKIWAWT